MDKNTIKELLVKSKAITGVFIVLAVSQLFLAFLLADLLNMVIPQYILQHSFE
jgi:hypothetical protein